MSTALHEQSALKHVPCSSIRFGCGAFWGRVEAASSSLLFPRLFLSCLCGLAAPIVLLGDHCQRGLPVQWGLALELQVFGQMVCVDWHRTWVPEFRVLQYQRLPLCATVQQTLAECSPSLKHTRCTYTYQRWSKLIWRLSTRPQKKSRICFGNIFLLVTRIKWELFKYLYIIIYTFTNVLLFIKLLLFK